MDKWIYVLLLSLITSVNFRFYLLKKDKGWYFGWWGIKAAVFFIVYALIFYFAMPAMVGPLGGFFKMGWFMLLTGAVFDGVMAFIQIEDGYRSKYRSLSFGRNILPQVGLSVLLLVFICSFEINSCARVDELRDLPAVKKVPAGQQIQQVDPKHIRLVPKRLARWKADKVIGKGGKNYGSMFKVGSLAIQRIAGRLYWVAPLEFRGVLKWNKQDWSPGFVMVDGEDPEKPARLVDHIGGRKLKMRYMQTAYWSKYLERHIYNQGYTDVRLMEFTFELTDKLEPRWVVSVLKPTVIWSGEKTLGVVIVNPENGDLKYYPLGKVPKWVDRVIPKTIAENYVKWWGKYVRGWWNSISWSAQKDVVKPTEVDDYPDMWLTYGRDGKGYWFTGVTSVSGSDSSLVGYIMMNSRTGETKFYQLTGNAEDAVVAAVNNVVKYRKWEGRQPILYNIYARLTWVLPVLAKSKKNPTYQGVAIVDALSTKVVFGATKMEALAKYRRYLSAMGKDSAPTSSVKMAGLKGCTILRINALPLGKLTTFHMLLDCKKDVVFTAPLTVSPELAVSQRGDKANVKFFDTSEAVVPLETFDNLGVTLRQSPVQKKFEKMKKREDGRQKNLDKQQQLRKKLKNLQDNL